MEIVSAQFVAGTTAYYFDDQAAIRHGARADGFFYTGAPQTPGYTTVRQPGESISVMLELSDGQWACGDCCAVQYSGAGGRDPLFLAERYLPVLRERVAPLLIERQTSDLIPTLKDIDALSPVLHTALSYGVSQALLNAAALGAHRTVTEELCARYELPLPTTPVPLFAQSGDERTLGAEKMLLRKVAALPHALINTIDGKLGRRGEELIDYVGWLRQRIARVGDGYRPDLHIDVYGTIGQLFDGDPDRVADYLVVLAAAAGDFTLFIEGPVDAGGREAQIDALARLRALTEARAPNLRLVADEWCNTLDDIREFVDARCCHMVQIKTPDLGNVLNIVDAVLYARQHGVLAYQGGSCNETDLAARCCTQIALACRPDRLLAKPGMGVDEGVQIVSNEMQRTLARIAARQEAAG